MGEDGHVASLFPGAGPLVTDAKEPFISVIGPKPPPQRVTMTFATLAAAREVWVLVSGSGKEIALHNSMASGGVTPLGYLLQIRKAVLFSSVHLV
jgi:6-phosphogluconolactonase